jgi:hypothetical protein
VKKLEYTYGLSCTAPLFKLKADSYKGNSRIPNSFRQKILKIGSGKNLSGISVRIPVGKTCKRLFILAM